MESIRTKLGSQGIIRCLNDLPVRSDVVAVAAAYYPGLPWRLVVLFTTLGFIFHLRVLYGLLSIII